jgi:hypothetical protein
MVLRCASNHPKMRAFSSEDTVTHHQVMKQVKAVRLIFTNGRQINNDENMS